MSVNKVILIGRLGQDPELRQTPGGAQVANFSLATNEVWNDKSGQRQESTEWHRIVVWGKQAELCSQYLSKGREAYLEGKLQTRQWQDQSGQKRYTTEIVASTVRFLGGGAQRSQNGDYQQNAGGYSNSNQGLTQGGGFEAAPGAAVNAEPTFTEDDIPF